MSTEDKVTLEQILETMDVPLERKGDLRWLSRNIEIRNWQHPRIEEATSIIRRLLKKV